MPSNTVAATIQPQLGAAQIMMGIGRAMIQPNRSTRWLRADLQEKRVAAFRAFAEDVRSGGYLDPTTRSGWIRLILRHSGRVLCDFDRLPMQGG